MWVQVGWLSPCTIHPHLLLSQNLWGTEDESKAKRPWKLNVVGGGPCAQNSRKERTKLEQHEESELAVLITLVAERQCLVPRTTKHYLQGEPVCLSELPASVCEVERCELPLPLCVKWSGMNFPCCSVQQCIPHSLNM